MLSVWNWGADCSCGGGKFLMASAISSGVATSPRRLYSRWSTVDWTICCQTSFRTWTTSSSVMGVWELRWRSSTACWTMVV